ncbi:MAG: YdcF family protein [Micromonosporaceae bacterium]|nr:YdcF family protein [Micromonosporaceae bacterium]
MRRSVRLAALGALALVLAAAGPFVWTRVAAAGHIYSQADLTGDSTEAGGDGPRADVVIVLGGQVAPDRTRPYNFLQGRLDTAAALLAAGRARVVLVSGDGNGQSGNETAVMTDYLASIGVDPDRVIADPYGLDTYDTCVRARQVYGITKALIVTQGYHLARALTLCRHAGIDADGVVAGCPDCRWSTQAQNWVRDYFAATKAAWDAWRNRPPAIDSPPSSEVADALTRW